MFAVTPGRALLLPLSVVGATFLVLRGAVATFGLVHGYSIGFAFYWIACIGTTGLALGWRSTVDLFARARPRLPPPRWLAWLVLCVPWIGGFFVAAMPYLNELGALVIVVSVARAIVNAVAEEVFWRGLYVRAFPGRTFAGWIAPALGFAAWHIVPLSVTGVTRDSIAMLAGAALIGLGNGWIALRTGSLRYTTIAHALTDAMGIHATLFVLGERS